jgi:hypothetical protein
MIVYWLPQMGLMVTSLTKVTVGVPLQLSEAVTEAGFGAGTFEPQVTVVLGGHVMVGNVLSNMVMV